MLSVGYRSHQGQTDTDSLGYLVLLITSYHIEDIQIDSVVCPVLPFTSKLCHGSSPGGMLLSRHDSIISNDLGKQVNMSITSYMLYILVICELYFTSNFTIPNSLFPTLDPSTAYEIIYYCYYPYLIRNITLEVKGLVDVLK